MRLPLQSHRHVGWRIVPFVFFSQPQKAVLGGDQSCPILVIRTTHRQWEYMTDSQESRGKCPMPDCDESLLYHEIVGVQAPGNPLLTQITKHVYECQKHGLFAYLGDGKFRWIES